MHARLRASEEECQFIDAKEIASRIQRAFPAAVIDWNRGDAWVDSKLQDLIHEGTPEAILEGHRRLFGGTVSISLSYPDWPGLSVESMVSGIHPENGDCVILDVVGGFDIALLKRGARDFSKALEFRFCLETVARSWCVWSITEPGSVHPLDLIDVPLGRKGLLKLKPEGSWESACHEAILRLRASSPEIDERLTADFPSHEEFASAVIHTLETVGSVEKGWVVDDEESPWLTRIVLHQGEWTTLLCVNGPAGWVE